MQRSLAIPFAHFQFSLKWLFALVTATAIVALVAKQCGVIEAIGTVFAILLFATCFRLRAFRWVKLVRGVLVTVALLVLWFVAVDYSVYREGCDKCGLHWWENRCQVFGRAVWHRKSPNHQAVISQMADDLGSPCRHEIEEWQSIRMWGLVLPYPAICGTCCFSGPDWYDETMRQRVRHLARQEPSLGQEFHDRVLTNYDGNYLRTFCCDIRAMEDP